MTTKKDTLKANLKQPSIRISKEDQARLWRSGADHAANGFRETLLKVQAQQIKLKRTMDLLDTFAQQLAMFAVKFDSTGKPK